MGKRDEIWRIPQIIEIYIKNQSKILVLKNTITSIENSVDRFNKLVEESALDLEHRSTENIQTKNTERRIIEWTKKNVCVYAQKCVYIYH